MSAPLVVNTTDGTCWTRRGALRGGEALYAPEGVCNCPPFVMATLAELAEHGIAGSADVLPVPVGPEPQAPDAGKLAKVLELIGDAKPASDGLLLSFGESVRDRREHDHASQREDWYCLNLSAYMGERMAPVLRRLLDAEARVAELEKENAGLNDLRLRAIDRGDQLRDRVDEVERAYTFNTAALKQRIAELEARLVASAEARHQMDPADAQFARLACEHPEACSRATDYPDWQPGVTR